MKELRAIVNACFVFLVFLLGYAFIHPGYVRSSSHPPRFLRMKVEALRGDVHPDVISLSAPYGLVGGAVRFATAGKIRRELDLCFTDSVASDLLRGAWKELGEKPMGAVVTRDEGGDQFRFRREGTSVIVEIVRGASCGRESEDKTSETAETPEGTAEEQASEQPRKPAEGDFETVTLRLPARLFEALIAEDKDLDVDTILAELESAGPGDLVDLKSSDARLRVWVE